MELQLQNSKEMIAVSDTVFGSDYKESLVHQLVTAYLAGARSGTKAQKNRSAVSGGGAKPWNQKGGGRARAGTIRSPLWRSGGVTFAAKPQDFSQKVNRKMYRAAMQTILSELVRQERLVVVEEMTVAEPKTKALSAMLKEKGLLDSTLIISEELDTNLFLASRNIPKIDVRDVAGIDPVSLVAYEKVVLTVPALKKIEEMFA